MHTTVLYGIDISSRYLIDTTAVIPNTDTKILIYSRSPTARVLCHKYVPV